MKLHVAEKDAAAGKKICRTLVLFCGVDYSMLVIMNLEVKTYGKSFIRH